MNKLQHFTKFLFGHNRRLKNIIRFSTRLRSINETVAEHSFYVCLYSMMLAEIWNEMNTQKVDILSVVKKAMFHDIEECASGDVITLFKRMMKDAYNKLSELSILTVFRELHEETKEDYSNIWRHNSKGLDGWIVDIADNLEGLVYCQENINLGNVYFSDIRKDYLKRIEGMLAGTKLECLHGYLVEVFKSEDTIVLHQTCDEERGVKNEEDKN